MPVPGPPRLDFSFLNGFQNDDTKTLVNRVAWPVPDRYVSAVPRHSHRRVAVGFGIGTVGLDEAASDSIQLR